MISFKNYKRIFQEKLLLDKIIYKFKLLNKIFIKREICKLFHIIIIYL